MSCFSFQKSTNHKYCQLFKASRHGIERLEIGDKEDDKNTKIITLENCVKITQEPSPANLIHVVTKTCTLTLNALTDDDLKLWLIALQNVAFKDKSSGTLTRHSVIEEDNDLYCTSYSDGIFTIRLLPSDVCAKCHLEAKQYVLHLTATDLQLKLSVDNEHGAIIIAKWPYRYIRKYGYRDGKFTFEAGRKCDTGEGVFSLEHTNPQEIFRCMAAKMKSMKNLISGDSIVSLDCGEHQFNAALSMEAGSRSPLPPSPNLHSHSKSDLSQSGHLFRGFLSSNDSLNNSSLIATTTNSTTSTSIPLLSSSSSSSSSSLIQSINKHIPNKPPRKSMTTIENISAVTAGQQQKYTKFQNYDIVTPPPQTSSSSSFNVSTENIVKTSAIILKQLPSTIESNGLTTTNHNNNTNTNNNNNKTIVNLVIANSQTTGECGTNNVTASEKPPELPVRNESKSLLSDSREYESIQIVTNAWLTRGIDDIKHTENVNSSVDEDLTEFVRQRNQSKDNIPMPLSPKNSNLLNNGFELDRKISQTSSTITTTTVSNNNNNKLANFGNYDRLEFFGTTSKTSNDYKTIVTITPPAIQNKHSANNYHSSSNDYEIIGGPDIQSCRLADDSHMGYGVIRQTISTSNISTTAIATPAQAILSDDELLDHRKYNGLDYAIVSKPKRV